MQCCTIMGNKDNICPQSQERTNILSTSKSSLIWQGRRGRRLSCTQASCRGRGEGLLGEPSTCVHLCQRYLPARTLQRAPLKKAKTLLLSRCLRHHPSSQSNHPDAILLPLSLPDLGLGKVGYFCGYFGHDGGLPCCYACFLVTDPPPLAQK